MGRLGGEQVVKECASSPGSFPIVPALRISLGGGPGLGVPRGLCCAAT